MLIDIIWDNFVENTERDKKENQLNVSKIGGQL